PDAPGETPAPARDGGTSEGLRCSSPWRIAERSGKDWKRLVFRRDFNGMTTESVFLSDLSTGWDMARAIRSARYFCAHRAAALCDDPLAFGSVWQTRRANGR